MARVARIDVERVRLPAEHTARLALERAEPLAPTQYVPEDPIAKRRHVMANALLLTESMAPIAHAAGRDALDALGVDDRLELFVSKHTVDTARLVLGRDPIGVEFLGRYLEIHDRAGITATIGHEIGHALAHDGDSPFAWAMAIAQTPTRRPRRTYSLAAELTADRFGLLTCRDLRAVLRLEMQSVVGSGGGVALDTEAYLDQCRAFAAELLRSGGGIVSSSHPDHYLRSYAEWLFTETDLYAELVGEGPASRSIDDVNDEIARLLLPPPTLVEARPRRPSVKSLSTGFAEIGDIAADMAGITHTAASETLARVASDVSSTLGALASAAAGTIQRGARGARSAEPEEPDLLEQEERDLLARFEELERRERGEE